MGSIEKPRISKATLDKKAESNFFTELKSRFQALEKENKELKQRNEFLENEYKELKEEREEIHIMCRKLDKEVQRLVDEINEPKELDDK
jgi:predicted nuclease with TOPRIM domain